MLTKCPECELQVSDKAITCPHCGYPIAGIANIKPKLPSKRMRLPNGFGQISEIRGKNLRKSFRAMVTVGKNEYGKPIQKILKPEGYFATYNEAYAALVEYNKNPYDLSDDLTMKQLFERWSDEYFPTLKNPSSIRTIKSSWAYCSEIYNMRVKDVRARHLKGCMNNACILKDGVKKEASSGIKSRIKSTFNLMFDYALEYELVDRNYARSFDISKDLLDDIEDNKRDHISFTQEELEVLWENIAHIPYADAIIVQCYSGWRPQELGLIEVKNVNLENWTMVGGMKTDAGMDRIVPIHPKIREIVKKKYNAAIANGDKYLITCTDGVSHKSNTTLTYDKYRHRFTKVIEQLKINPDHKAHDGRKTFVTLCKKYKVDEYAIKYMIGHKISDLTENTYTDREVSWLTDEIIKIP